MCFDLSLAAAIHACRDRGRLARICSANSQSGSLNAGGTPIPGHFSIRIAKCGRDADPGAFLDPDR
jgi:hypothetical protein